MATRSSTRHAAAKANEALQQSSQPGKKKPAAGQKRKEPAELDGSKSKREKHDDEQKEVNGSKPAEPSKESTEALNQEESREETKAKTEPKEPSDEKEEVKDESEATEKKEEKGPEGPTAVRESQGREEAVPSNILEKGIVYFFFRGKVNVDEPESVDEIARTFIVLRPLPQGASLGQGPIGDDENCRLLVLPKKTVPTSGKERFMGFVEKAGTTVKTLRDSFLGGEYETKTKGTQHTPTATPVAEGVYAITSTTRASHLAYITTIPSELSEVQTDFGLRDKGSFIISAKNPKYPGPSTARLPKSPEYPEEVLKEFQDLRWVPMQPKFMDYPNAQFLMIGEAQDKLGKGGMTEEKAPEEEEAAEELENLEHENEVRAHPLKGNDAVFDDLGLSAKEFPKVATTWE